VRLLPFSHTRSHTIHTALTLSTLSRYLPIQHLPQKAANPEMIRTIKIVRDQQEANYRAAYQQELQELGLNENFELCSPVSFFVPFTRGEDLELEKKWGRPKDGNQGIGYYVVDPGGGASEGLSQDAHTVEDLFESASEDVKLKLGAIGYRIAKAVAKEFPHPKGHASSATPETEQQQVNQNCLERTLAHCPDPKLIPPGSLPVHGKKLFRVRTKTWQKYSGKHAPHPSPHILHPSSLTPHPTSLTPHPSPHIPHPTSLAPPTLAADLGDYSKVLDMLRTSIVCGSLLEVDAALRYLRRSKDINVRRYKDRLSPSTEPAAGGYRDFQICLVIDGYVVELQLHLQRIIGVKHGSGHQAYKWFRLINVDDNRYEGSDEPSLRRHTCSCV
jgi:hypothetical protein